MDEKASSSLERTVEQHYGQAGIEERLLEALSQSGVDIGQLRAEDLVPLDELHIGGREATAELAAQMQLEPGMKLLDIGCGIGGPARYFASVHGCSVTGVDLTAEFVKCAEALSKRVKLGDRVTFRQGSGLELPVATAAFDRAYLLHVGMNISAKAELIAEARRVLKPGGIFAIYDVMRTGPGEFKYPVPWANSAASSFLEEPRVYREALKEQGFEIVAARERRIYAIEFFERLKARVAQGEVLPALGMRVIMGPDAPDKRANLVDALQRGVLAPVELIGRLPG